MRKLSNQNIRKLTKVGGKSYGITIPIEIVKNMKLKERQKLVVRQSGQKIIVEDWKK